MEMLEYFSANFNLLVIAGSFVVAVLGSFLSLSLARLALRRKAKADHAWLSLLAGVSLGGIGIWSMHFIGMTAYQGGDLSYGMPLTVASLLISITVVSLGLYTMLSGIFSYAKLLAAGVFVAAGVVSMHYLGMDAINATLSYNMPVVYASVVIAVVAAVAALWLLVNVSGMVLTALSAVVMGVAVCGMHYTGMFAVSIDVSAVRGRGDDVMLLAMIVLIDVCVLVLAGALGHLRYGGADDDSADNSVAAHAIV